MMEEESEIDINNNVKDGDFEPMQIESQDNTADGASSQRLWGRGKFIAVVGLLIITYIAFFGMSLPSSERNNTPKEPEVDVYTDVDGVESTAAASTPTPTSISTLAASPTKSPTARVKVTKSDGEMYETIGDAIYHDKKHFTQGLTYSRATDTLFESNGLYGKSSVCQLDPETGESRKCKKMKDQYFAEGMQVYGTPKEDGGEGEKLIQITWKERTGFIYDASTLDVLQSFTFTSTRNEGWGICVDESKKEFIMSDGSQNLHFIDMHTLKEKRRVAVIRQTGMEARNINELEFYNGRVLANVWYEDVILVIDPVTGECESEYDMSMLWPVGERRENGADVLNGISISKDDGILYITGKRWDRMYKLKLKHL